MKLEFSDIFSKNTQIPNLMKILPVEAELFYGNRRTYRHQETFFLVQCHHMVVLPPGHGSSVTDFWGWDAREAQLRCPDDVSGDIGEWSARRALKP
jgi:hypothetical protein